MVAVGRKYPIHVQTFLKFSSFGSSPELILFETKLRYYKYIGIPLFGTLLALDIEDSWFIEWTYWCCCC